MGKNGISLGRLSPLSKKYKIFIKGIIIFIHAGLTREVDHQSHDARIVLKHTINEERSVKHKENKVTKTVVTKVMMAFYFREMKSDPETSINSDDVSKIKHLGTM